MSLQGLSLKPGEFVKTRKIKGACCKSAEENCVDANLFRISKSTICVLFLAKELC